MGDRPFGGPRLFQRPGAVDLRRIPPVTAICGDNDRIARPRRRFARHARVFDDGIESEVRSGTENHILETRRWIVRGDVKPRFADIVRGHRRAPSRRMHLAFTIFALVTAGEFAAENVVRQHNLRAPRFDHISQKRVGSSEQRRFQTAVDDLKPPAARRRPAGNLHRRLDVQNPFFPAKIDAAEFKLQHTVPALDAADGRREIVDGKELIGSGVSLADEFKPPKSGRSRRT